MSVTRYSNFDRTIPNYNSLSLINPPIDGMVVKVVDASDDPSVRTGQAIYRWNEKLREWLVLFKNFTKSLAFKTEEIVIKNGRLNASFAPVNNQIWNIEVLHYDISVANPRLEDLVVFGNEISGLNPFSNKYLRFTYAYATEKKKTIEIPAGISTTGPIDMVALLNTKIDIVDTYSKREVDIAFRGLDAARLNNVDNTADIDKEVYSSKMLTTPVNITLSGDANGVGIFDGLTPTVISVTVDDDSHNHNWNSITGKPSTLLGYGITDLYTKTETDAQIIIVAPPQSNSGNINKGTTLVHYGITDAYTKSGTLTAISTQMGVSTGSLSSLSSIILRESTADTLVNGFSTLLSKKEDKVTGKGLVTLDYTDTEQTKVSGIELGAQVNIITSISGVTPLVGAVTLTPADVGLGNVNMTSDILKKVNSMTKLHTPVTITLSGDATGSVSFNGSADVVINTTITDDSHNHSYNSLPSLVASPGVVTLSSLGITDAYTKTGYDARIPILIPQVNLSLYADEATTLAGYGITDAQPKLISGVTIKTVNFDSLLLGSSYNVSLSGVPFDPSYNTDTTRTYTDNELFLSPSGKLYWKLNNGTDSKFYNIGKSLVSAYAPIEKYSAWVNAYGMFLISNGNIYQTGKPGNGSYYFPGFSVQYNTPTQVTTSGDWSKVTGYGSDIFFFIKKNGELWGMGNNTYNGMGSVGSNSIPVQIKDISGGIIKDCYDVSASRWGTVIHRISGIYSAGNGYLGGYFGNVNSNLGITTFTPITRGGVFNVATYDGGLSILSNGKLIGGGSSQSGELAGTSWGDNCKDIDGNPVYAKKLWACTYASFIINSNNELMISGGYNSSYGSSTNHFRKVLDNTGQVINNIKSVAVSQYALIIVLDNGELWSCGTLNRGTGLNSANHGSLAYTGISGVDCVAQMDWASESSLIVMLDGSVYTSGSNNYGQLGINSTTTSTNFVSTGLTIVGSVGCGVTTQMLP